MNWRIWPSSSRTCRERAGYFVTRSLRASATVLAALSNFGVPSVNRRNAVGISIVIAIASPVFRRDLLLCLYRLIELLCQQGFEGFEFWGNRFRCGEVRGDGLGGFQAVSGDAHHGSLVVRDASLLDELRGHPRGDPAGGLCEDSFGLRQQFDGVDD